MYDIKKVQKTAKKSKTNYFKKPHKKKESPTKQKNSRLKARGHKTFSRLARQLEEENKLNYKLNYKQLEKELDIDIKKWGVEAVAAKVVELITISYELSLAKNPNQNQQQLIHDIYQEGQAIIKDGFMEARETILPLPAEINKLLVTTYKLSKQKLTAWKQKETKQPMNPPTELNYSLPDLKKQIAELFTKQGIYFKEARTKLPAINLKA